MTASFAFVLGVLISSSVWIVFCKSYLLRRVKHLEVDLQLAHASFRQLNDTHTLLRGAHDELLEDRVRLAQQTTQAQKELEELLEQHAKVKEDLRVTSWFDHRVPVGSRFYFDRDIGRECVRCQAGTITRRYRFQVVGNENEGTTIKKLSGVTWCSNCNFRAAVHNNATTG